MRRLIQDARYGLRQLAKAPGFTAVAVLTLGLGIGANTAIFSVFNGVIVRPLPYPKSERIIQITGTYKGQLQYSEFSAQEFKFFSGHSEPFEFLAAQHRIGFNLTGGTEPVRVQALRVSSGYFNVLGVQPVIGRSFSPDEDRTGGPSVVVLSYTLWKDQFGGDPLLIGKSVSLDGADYTVVGVAPRSFQSIPAADIWTTIAQVDRTIGSGYNYTVIGRLKDGTSREQANNYFATVKTAFFQQFRRGISVKYLSAISLDATPLIHMITQDYRQPLIALFGAIGFVLLIACVNVANLLLSRSVVREKEMAIRGVLGASPPRLFSQLMVESLLIVAIGSALGLLLAYWGLSPLLALAPRDLPRTYEVALDKQALGFTAATAIVTAILFGTAPALHASRANLIEALREGGGRGNLGFHSQRIRSTLVVVEVALSLVLLSGASLTIRTFANLLNTDLGFNPRNLLCMPIWPTGEKFSSTETMVNFEQHILESLQTIPGVQSASIVVGGLPLEAGGNEYVELVGRKAREGGSVDYREITPAYFQTLGVPLMQGRFFTDLDSTKSNRVAIISKAMALEFYEHNSPIGEKLSLENQNWEIIGVVGDVRSELNEPALPTVFVPSAQAPITVTKEFINWHPSSILLRTAQNPLSISKNLREIIRINDSQIPIGRIETMDQILSNSIGFHEFLMTMMSIFAGLALLLATVGIYGLMSYSVTQESHEIGVRMAVGSPRSDVLKSVIRRGMLLTLTGIILGLAGAIIFTRLLNGQLYNVRPTDPRLLGMAVAALGLSAFLACWVPARRAARLDPVVTLRCE